MSRRSERLAWRRAALLSDEVIRESELRRLHLMGNRYVLPDLVHALRDNVSGLTPSEKLLEIGHVYDLAGHNVRLPYEERRRCLEMALDAYRECFASSSNDDLVAATGDFFRGTTIALRLMTTRHERPLTIRRFVSRSFDPASDDWFEYLEVMRAEVHAGNYQAAVDLSQSLLAVGFPAEAGETCEVAAFALRPARLERPQRNRLIALAIDRYYRANKFADAKRIFEHYHDDLDGEDRNCSALAWAGLLFDRNAWAAAYAVHAAEIDNYGGDHHARLAVRCLLRQRSAALELPDGQARADGLQREAERLIRRVLARRLDKNNTYEGPTDADYSRQRLVLQLVEVLALGPDPVESILQLIAQQESYGLSGGTRRSLAVSLASLNCPELAMEQLATAAQSGQADDVSAYAEALIGNHQRIEAYRQYLGLFASGNTSVRSKLDLLLRELGAYPRRLAEDVGVSPALLAATSTEVQGKRPDAYNAAMDFEKRLPKSPTERSLQDTLELARLWATADEWARSALLVTTATGDNSGADPLRIAELDAWRSLIADVARMSDGEATEQVTDLARELRVRGCITQARALLESTMQHATDLSVRHLAQMELGQDLLHSQLWYEAYLVLAVEIGGSTPAQQAARLDAATTAAVRCDSLYLAELFAFRAAAAGALPHSEAFESSLAINRPLTLPALCVVSGRQVGWAEPWAEAVFGLATAKGRPQEARRLFAWAVSHAAEQGLGTEAVFELVDRLEQRFYPVDKVKSVVTNVAAHPFIADALGAAVDVGGPPLKLLEAVKRAELGQRVGAALAFRDMILLNETAESPIPTAVVARTAIEIASRFTQAGDHELAALVWHETARSSSEPRMWVRAAAAWGRSGRPDMAATADAERLASRLAGHVGRAESFVPLRYPAIDLPDDPNTSGGSAIPMPPTPDAPLSGPSATAATPQTFERTGGSSRHDRAPGQVQGGPRDALTTGELRELGVLLETANSVTLRSLVAAGDPRLATTRALEVSRAHLHSPQLAGPVGRRDSEIDMLRNVLATASELSRLVDTIDGGVALAVVEQAATDAPLQSALHVHAGCSETLWTLSFDETARRPSPPLPSAPDKTGERVAVDAVEHARAILHGQIEQCREQSWQRVEATRRALVSLLDDPSTSNRLSTLVDGLSHIPEVEPLSRALTSRESSDRASTPNQTQVESVIDTTARLVGEPIDAHRSPAHQLQHLLDVARLRIAIGHTEGPLDVVAEVLDEGRRLTVDDIGPTDSYLLSNALRIAREASKSGDWLIATVRQRAEQLGESPVALPATSESNLSTSPTAISVQSDGEPYAIPFDQAAVRFSPDDAQYPAQFAEAEPPDVIENSPPDAQKQTFGRDVL